MKLVGLVPKWRKLLPTGVIQSVFAWDVGLTQIATKALDEKPRWAVVGALAENLNLLRYGCPQAYVLTNNRTTQDPLPTGSTWPQGLESEALKRLPHVRLKMDLFSSPEIPKEDQLSYLLEYGREDVSSFFPDLLGDRPPPLYAGIFLAEQGGLCRWVEEVTPVIPSPEEWKSVLLTRFRVFLWGHERELLFVESRDETLLEYPK